MTQHIAWEGKIYNQLSSAIKKNYSNTSAIILKRNLLFKPLPLKIYRREIASVDISVCNPRTSVKIDQNNMPGVNIITNSNRGINTSVDFKYENNTCQHPSLTITDSTYCNQFSAAKNARRRVRTSGIMKSNYNSSNAQYLNTRNLSFKQNEYFHIRQGDALAVPGTLAASRNIYASNNTVVSCQKYYIASSTYFDYNWINASNIRVTIPSGNYDIDDLNNLLQYKMLTQKHYLIVASTNAKIFFLKFSYNLSTNRIQLLSTTSNDTIFPSSSYNYPVGSTWTLPVSPTYFNPNIILSDSIICNAIGFVSGTYPATNSGSSTNFTINGSYSPLIQPNYYVPIYYKPNNSKFGVQGAVSSSDLITRKKYLAITNTANSFRTAYGNQTADALAYGVPEYGYTKKDKVGFPIIKCPVISKYSGQLKCCQRVRTIRSMLNG